MKTKYLERNIDKALLEWKNSAEHKPILLRGARQVGKFDSCGFSVSCNSYCR